MLANGSRIHESEISSNVTLLHSQRIGWNLKSALLKGKSAAEALCRSRFYVSFQESWIIFHNWWRNPAIFCLNMANTVTPSIYRFNLSRLQDFVPPVELSVSLRRFPKAESQPAFTMSEWHNCSFGSSELASGAGFHSQHFDVCWYW